MFSNTVVPTVKKQPPEVFFKKKGFLKISQKNTCVGVSFDKVAAVTFLKRDSNTGVFL